MRRMLHAIFIIILFCGFTEAQVELKDSSGSVLGNFTNIQTAYDSIPSFIEKSYILEILPSYDSTDEVFPIILSYRDFEDDKYTITLRPQSSGILIEADTLVEVFRIDSAKNIIIDGRPMGKGDSADLRIGNYSTGDSAYTINIINSSFGIILKYLHVFNSTQSDTLGRNIQIGWSMGGGNRNITITNCLIEGGRSGVLSLGNSSAPNSGILVKDCVIKDFGWVGVKIFVGTRTMDVEGCTIYQTEGYNVYVPSGISISGTSQAVNNIKRNKIYNIQSSAGGAISMRGIYVFQSNTARVNIENNFISLPVTFPGEAHNVYGIVMMGVNDFSASIRNNNIYIGGTHYGGGAGRVVSAGIMRYNTGTIGLYEQINNIIVNERSGGRTGVIHAASVIQNVSPNHEINYNTYYVTPGEGKFVTGWDTLMYNNIEEYQNASGVEDSSNIYEVSFISQTDLHLSESHQHDSLLKGKALTDISTDIDGEIRDDTSPYRGADELMIILSAQEDPVVTRHMLSQNYPNPFNPVTVITYSIRNATRVTIKIYDITGSEVSVLLNEYKEAGTHKVNFDARNFSSGTYFYRIEAGEFTETKKMILLH